MITLRDSIEIKATPEKVFEWIIQRFMSKKAYKAWHPDHIDIRWIKGEPLKEGSILYAEEYLHGQLHKLKFRITTVVPNKEIIYRALFPFSLFAPENGFLFEPKGENSCVFTATGRIRGGPIFKKFGKKKLDATLQHVKEEGENLKKIIESSQ